jgi:hypothetical protein
MQNLLQKWITNVATFKFYTKCLLSCMLKISNKVTERNLVIISDSFQECILDLTETNQFLLACLYEQKRST